MDVLRPKQLQKKALTPSIISPLSFSASILSGLFADPLVFDLSFEDKSPTFLCDNSGTPKSKFIYDLSFHSFSKGKS